MKIFTKTILLGICLISLLGSCTVQKRRYSSGYHINWHHQNKTAATKNSKEAAQKFTSKATQQNIGELYTHEKINYDQFTDKQPLPIACFPNITNRNPVQLSMTTVNPDLAYIPTRIDTQVTLTPQEMEDHYFINSSGQKKKYRRGLRNFLVMGGLISMLFGFIVIPLLFIGMGMLIGGLFMPKPNRRSLIVSDNLMKKSKNDNKAAVATGLTAALVVLIVLVGFIIVIGLLFAV